MATTSSNTDLHGYGEAIRKELGRRITRDKKLKVLDVGTGFGINVAFLSSWLSKGSSIWTVDPSKEVLTNVEAALGNEGAGRVSFVEASADDLGFADGFFDVVVSVMVLHHIESLQPALKEMARVLRPGRTLVIVDYKPEASHELEFTTRHEEADFFEPAAVVEGIGRIGMVGKPSDHGIWYLVEANKKGPRASRPAASSGGRAKAPSGR
jgi:ubiquinone/menaquinone biosynthesis C-methylase UbiE